MEMLVFTGYCEKSYFEGHSESHLKKPGPNISKESRHKLEAMNGNEKNPLVHLQGVNLFHYMVISGFMNTKKNILYVDKDLTVNFTFTEEETMFIQSTGGDTMRVTARKSYRTYNIISGGIVFHFKNSENEHPDEIKNGLSLYCSGLINEVQK